MKNSMLALVLFFGMAASAEACPPCGNSFGGFNFGNSFSFSVPFVQTFQLSPRFRFQPVFDGFDVQSSFGGFGGFNFGGFQGFQTLPINFGNSFSFGSRFGGFDFGGNFNRNRNFANFSGRNFNFEGNLGNRFNIRENARGGVRIRSRGR